MQIYFKKSKAYNLTTTVPCKFEGLKYMRPGISAMVPTAYQLLASATGTKHNDKAVAWWLFQILPLSSRVSEA